MLFGINLSFSFVIFFVVHFTSHSEIGHFDDSVFRQQNISGGQVAVENLNKIEMYILSISQKQYCNTFLLVK